MSTLNAMSPVKVAMDTASALVGSAVSLVGGLFTAGRSGSPEQHTPSASNAEGKVQSGGRKYICGACLLLNNLAVHKTEEEHKSVQCPKNSNKVSAWMLLSSSLISHVFMCGSWMQQKRRR